MQGLKQRVRLSVLPFRFVMLLAAAFILLAGMCKATPPMAFMQVDAGAAKPLATQQATMSFQQARMAEVIAALSKQSGLSIVVNDEPRDNQADLKFSGSLKDALDKVADAYDYTWKLNKQGVVLMTKRFSRQREYPPLNAQELNQTARDMVAILEAFNFDFQKNVDLNTLIYAAYESLTPEQNAMLRAGKIIRVAQLSAAQKQQIENIILTDVLVHPWQFWSMLATQTQALANATPDSYALLRSVELGKTIQDESETEKPVVSLPRFGEAFEYRVVNKRKEEQAISIITNGMFLPLPTTPQKTTGKNNAPQPVQSGPVTPVLPSDTPTPLSPQTDKPDTLPQGLSTPSHLRLGATTLKAVLQSLSTQTGLQIQTETYLEDRKLVMELDNGTAQSALDAVAELNDWRWFSPDKGIIKLTRKRPRLPQTLADLSACMSTALPADYRAFLGIGVARKDLPEKIIYKPDGKAEAVPNFFAPDFFDREERLNARFGNLVQYQSQRLHKAFQADLNDSMKAALKAGKPLTWNFLTPAQHTDIGDVILLNGLYCACKRDIILLNNGLRPYQSDMNTVEIHLHNGNSLEIGSSKNGVYSGTGAIIPGLKSTATKRPTPSELAQP